MARPSKNEVIDYTTTRFETAVSDVDVVVDLVGTRDYGLRSLTVLRPGGLYVGVPSGVGPDVLRTAARAGLRATGILVEPDGAALSEIAVLAGDGRLRPEVEAVFELADAAKAHEQGEQGERGHTRGKLVLSVD